MEKRAVIYIRVSDPSQVENNSLETQEKYCRSFAISHGYEVIKIYSDEGKSAKHVNTRPALKESMVFCSTKKNNIDALIVYKYDRFSRDVSEGLSAISLLAKYGVEVISATEVSELNPIGKAIRTILMASGQLDNEIKGERVKHNMIEVFKKGLWPFKPPIGYKRKFKTKDENKGIPPIPHPQLTPIITEMFNKAATGIYSKSQLARIMNLAGFGDYYHTEASHKIVDNILSKTFYYGYMYAPKWNEYAWGQHVPMIEKAIWENAYNKVILKKKRYAYQDDTLYPLKGTIKCHLCGQIMTTCPSQGRNGKVYYYECKNKLCRKVRINAEIAHTQFNDILKQVRPSKRVIKLFSHLVFSEWDSVINQAKSAIQQIDNRIASLNNELTSIRKAKDDGIYTVNEAKEQAASIRRDISILEIEKTDIKIEQFDTEIVQSFTEYFLYNFPMLWRRLDLTKRQELQRKIFVGGIICEGLDKIRTAEMSPSFELIEAIAAQKGKNVIY